MSARIHFISFIEPLREGFDRNADCGAPIAKAWFSACSLPHELGEVSTLTHCPKCMTKTAEMAEHFKDETYYVHSALQWTEKREQEAL